MTAYWIFFVSNVVLNFVKNKRMYYYVVLPLFIVVFGLRYKVGPDWGQYEQVFYYPESSSFEIGYLFLNNVVRYFFDDFNVLIFIIFTFVTTTHFVFWQKMTDNYNYAILLWLGLGFLSFGILRQSIAMAIFLIAVLLWKNDKKIYAYLIAAFAILFHDVAIVAIPVLYFVNKSFNKKVLITLVGISFMLHLTNLNLIFINVLSNSVPKIGFYLNAGGEFSAPLGLGLRFIEVTGILLVATFFYEQCKKNNENFPLMYQFGAIYLYCFLLLNPVGTVASRTSKLFEFAFVLLLIQIINLIENENLRVLVFMGAVAYAGLRYYLTITGEASLQSNTQFFLPYQNILFK